MQVKSFGCSFIFGSELADDGKNGLYAIGSRLTWPALLAKHYNYQYQTHARPGSGNLQILERMLNQTAVSDNLDLFVIGWTWIDRFDYYDSEYYSTSPTQDPPGPFSGFYRVFRGGSWLSWNPTDLRVANRDHQLPPSSQLGFLGFRCAK